MTDHNIDNNLLEKLLPKAFKSAEGNHDFLALLFQSDVFIFGGEGGDGGFKTLASESKVDIMQWVMQDGTPIIPAFTSVAELQKAIEGEDANYMALNAGALLNMLKDIGVVINPMSDYAYRIDVEDIEPMLAHFLNHDHHHAEGDPNEVLLGHPQEELVSALKTALSGFFKGQNNVAYACLALMARAGGDQSVLVGVSFGQGAQSQDVIDGVAETAKPHMPQGFGLDLVVLPEPPTTGGVEGYLQQNGDRFYTR